MWWSGSGGGRRIGSLIPSADGEMMTMGEFIQIPEPVRCGCGRYFDEKGECPKGCK